MNSVSYSPVFPFHPWRRAEKITIIHPPRQGWLVQQKATAAVLGLPKISATLRMPILIPEHCECNVCDPLEGTVSLKVREELAETNPITPGMKSKGL